MSASRGGGPDQGPSQPQQRRIMRTQTVGNLGESFDSQEHDPTLMGRVEKSDARVMQSFYQHYYKKYIQALQNAADKANRAQLTKAYQTANVLFEVLKAVNLTQSIKVDRKGFENDSESSLVFWLLKERELTPSNSNILDGRYDVFGGYVTQNEDFLADLKVDDVTDTSTILAALKYGRCSSTVEVEVRLLRFWEARNIKRGGHLMGVDMLLLDSKAMLIPATINVNRLPTYRGHLKDDKLEGDAALNKFFREIYLNSDEDMRSARANHFFAQSTGGIYWDSAFDRLER
ncbi:hypothetical protein F2Q68_00006915 [Brassica cretica]|uniref:peptidylprolyl isomerase n=1 Tax=Brassica cretica TaxID=69181 RepID=A0A8S9JPB5_BRACR|nr:hypothetical protein F2Q68_00006915 [Brassica cretica]